MDTKERKTQLIVIACSSVCYYIFGLLISPLDVYIHVQYIYVFMLKWSIVGYRFIIV